jgi:hypothetical protein
VEKNGSVASHWCAINSKDSINLFKISFLLTLWLSYVFLFSHKQTASFFIRPHFKSITVAFSPSSQRTNSRQTFPLVLNVSYAVYGNVNVFLIMCISDTIALYVLAKCCLCEYRCKQIMFCNRYVQFDLFWSTAIFPLFLTIWSFFIHSHFFLSAIFLYFILFLNCYKQ